jgi:RNA polymerase sigma-70 factor (ECF subfamily)
MHTDEESIYLQELGEGTHRSFDALFILYQPKVKAFLSGFIKDNDEVSDMTQEIFLKIWVNRKNVSQVVSFKAYLFRMARNMVYDHFEHSRVRDTYEKRQLENPPHAELIEENIYAKDLELLINIAIEQMPKQRKRVYKMSREEGLTNDEIAERLQINKRTVENHLSQALSELRKLIRNTYSLLM